MPQPMKLIHWEKFGENFVILTKKLGIFLKMIIFRKSADNQPISVKNCHFRKIPNFLEKMTKNPDFPSVAEYTLKY